MFSGKLVSGKRSQEEVHECKLNLEPSPAQNQSAGEAFVSNQSAPVKQLFSFERLDALEWQQGIVGTD